MSKSEIKDFIKKLRNEEVYFKYIKNDGTLRRAHGTMKPKMIPKIKNKIVTQKQLDKSENNIKKRRQLPEDSIFYFDLDKQAFRSFKSTKFEGIIKDIKENIMKNKLNESELTPAEIEVFKRMLFNGEVKFKFQKVDGTIREARGTMKPELLPPPPPEKQYDKDKLQNKKDPRKRPSGVICFYDLDAQGFRSFKTSNFLEFIN